MCSATLGQCGGNSDGEADSMDSFWTTALPGTPLELRMPRLGEPGLSSAVRLRQTFTPCERR
ncbi:hypothetical protein SAM23877_5545 [Streptomyces ambofaciens ATCC 23877]|uniref:Uncharacterized protein n=1 Tax=Streptomyces ambofaciens (strain ATCC 23877 / 3486 / DSM 40053 / JCM 4204 / NBRC 12836 / NRRL B-2516) TaxID=278992 RepID=A0A0K2AZP8_STRA7|nr:hypothetical protein SAM23877_5545 [Streptomyces ambofaciens ATCC 23877]